MPFKSGPQTALCLFRSPKCKFLLCFWNETDAYKPKTAQPLPEESACHHPQPEQQGHLLPLLWDKQ